MPTVRIPPGVARGESRAMVPGRFYATSLVRWHEGNLKPVGGWDRISAQPFPSVPRAALTWTDNAFRRHMAVLCDGHVFRALNSDWTNITPADLKNAESVNQSSRGYGAGSYGLADYGQDDEPRGTSYLNRLSFPVFHGLDNWGEELLFGSSADGRIFVWKPSAPEAVPVVAANTPKLMQAFLSTEEHHLMVFGGDGFPNRVAWSDQGNREGWDYTRVTGQAGFQDLEGAGQILSARRIPGGILVFTQTSVWLGQYIGAPYYYGFKKVAESVAPVSPQAIAVAAGKAYWMGAKGFHKYEGGVVQPLPCSLDLDPSEGMDTNNAPRRVCAGFNGVYPEIWFFYPSAGQNVETPENDRYCVYNFVDGWWADGSLARSCISTDLIEGFPLLGAPNGNVYQHEIGYLAEGQPREGLVWAEVSSVGFDDGEHNWTVTQAQVDGRRAGGADAQAVRFDFSGVTARGGPWASLGSWKPNATGYMDARFTARDFSYRVVGLKDVPWSIGAVQFTAKIRGGR
jgi:hypothetical protein